MAGASAVPELAALRAKVNAFPTVVTEHLRAVAWRTSRRVKELAQQKVAKDTHFTEENIHVVEDPARKLFLVIPGTDRPRVRIVHHAMRSGRSHTQAVTLNMLPVWLEYGTIHMVARPFMRPAADAESARYVREMRAAAEAVAVQELGSL
jgi:hypothetical protein